MLTYALLLLVLFGGMILLEAVPSKNTRRNQLVFAWIVIVLFWGSVDARDFGTDISVYYDNACRTLHLGYSQYLDITPFEKGYATLIWLSSNIFKTPQALLFIQIAFVTYSVFRFIYRNSKDVFLSVVTYICLGCFGLYLYAFRQAFAIAVCLFALECIQKRKKVWAVVLILFASLFHQTAIVFLPVIFIDNKKLNQKNIFIFSLIMIAVSFTLNYTLPQANEIFEMEYGKENISSATGGIINILIDLIAFILIIFKYKKVPAELKDEEFKTLSFIVFIGIAAFALYLCRFHTLALERVAFYFLPAFCILFAEGLTNHARKRIPDISFLFVILSMVLFLYRSTTSLGVYHSIWW